MTTENVLKIKSLLKGTMNAQETMSQIKAGGVIKMMSWAARNFTNIQNKGLMFRVSGYKHKGYVLVTLDYSDTYTVYLLNMKCEIVKEMENVYCDELTDKIDKEVEYIPDYKDR